MNEQKVHELLRRYFDGATSLDEERELQRCLVGEDIPDSLKAYCPMFTFFAEERAIEPAARAVRLNRAIVVGIAASIAILLLVGLPKTQPDPYAYYVDGQRVYDEAAAIESAANRLQMLAASVQKARSSMGAFAKLQESNQSLQQFGKIASAYRTMEEAGAKIRKGVKNEKPDL
ncbi:MAG: hypothetical protein LBM08_01180 [Dysgonamonadaceae bacterium]|jgi:hypothetical protein|nr:hypothetical protein [Dysgonamonadaceae bacterium]